jgi:hypothetical protein
MVIDNKDRAVSVVDVVNHYRGVWPCRNLQCCYFGSGGDFYCGIPSVPGYLPICTLAEFEKCILKLMSGEI